MNRWPAWLDLENIFIRSKFSYQMVPGVITAVSRFMDNLATSWLFAKAIPTVITAVTRFADEFMDNLAVGLRHSVLAHKKTPKPVPVGNKVTYCLGRMLDGIANFLNRTILRKHPITTDFEYIFDVGRKEMGRDVRLLARTMSFGLLLLCIGLYITCWYLLN